MYFLNLGVTGLKDDKDLVKCMSGDLRCIGKCNHSNTLLLLLFAPSVHTTDSVRIELKIPPDQHIYLRAATPAERQQWLVALGTAKACITQAHSAKRDGTAGQCKYCIYS